MLKKKLDGRTVSYNSTDISANVQTITCDNEEECFCQLKPRDFSDKIAR